MARLLAGHPAAGAPLHLGRGGLAFARSLGDFGITIMFAGNIPGRTQTVAVAIYDAVESGNGALARTLAVISPRRLAILSVANRLSAREAA